MRIEEYYDLPDKMNNPKVLNILHELWQDFTDRRGLRQQWDMIDEEIQIEILQTWYKIIENGI